MMELSQDEKRNDLRESKQEKKRANLMLGGGAYPLA